MSYQCEICGKGFMRGNLVSHSKQRMHRLYRPNLHMAKAVINGANKNVRVCTKCLRKIKEKIKPVTSVTQKKMVAIPVVEPTVQTPKEIKVKTTTVEELMKKSSFAKAMEDKEASKEEKKEPVKKKRPTSVRLRRTLASKKKVE